MAPVGHLLLWLGFLAASCASVWRLENAEHKWSTIPWGAYAAAMFVGVLGVILLRMHRSAHTQHEDRVHGEYRALRSSLDQLLAGIAELRSSLRDDDPGEIVRFIDDQMMVPFADFADARNGLVQRYGLAGFAEVMTPFASAERFVNRAWSAAADGYIEEAKSSLERAHLHLDQTNEVLLQLDDTLQQTGHPSDQ